MSRDNNLIQELQTLTELGKKYNLIYKQIMQSMFTAYFIKQLKQNALIGQSCYINSIHNLKLTFVKEMQDNITALNHNIHNITYSNLRLTDLNLTKIKLLPYQDQILQNNNLTDLENLAVNEFTDQILNYLQTIKSIDDNTFIKQWLKPIANKYNLYCQTKPTISSIWIMVNWGIDIGDGTVDYGDKTNESN